MVDYPIIEVQELLTARGVPWSDDHPNITQRAIGVCCPWCGDDSFHLGIFKDGGNFTCWRCGRSGPLWRLTERLFGMGREALELALGSGVIVSDEPALKQIHRIFGEATSPPETARPEPTVISLPPSRPIQPGQVPRLIQQFLNKRRFTIEHCVKYEARYSPMARGGWAYRLILPVRMDGHLIGCVGRALDSREPRYLNMKGVSLKSLGTLYGTDNWRGSRLILVEGPLDVWRLGDEACATLGASMTTAQRERVWAMQPDELLIAWDPGTYWSALGLGRQLMPLLRSVKVLRLPAGQDPDDLGLEGIEGLADGALAL